MLLSLYQLLLFLCLVIMGSSFKQLSVSASAATTRPQSTKSWERERDKAYARQQFTKSFQVLQTISQNLLKEHENNHLTAERLAKDARLINKSAKTLRSLMVLGEVAEPLKVDKEISTPQQFDQSIRRLAKHIYDFAHNPIHQSSKVFNTNQAQRAHTDLLAIIDLSKAIENKAKGYSKLT